jgi:hypothetical protein
MNQDQLTSLVRTALKVIGTALITHGATTAANVLNGEDVRGPSCSSPDSSGATTATSLPLESRTDCTTTEIRH